jgi:hypothetical protein
MNAPIIPAPADHSCGLCDAPADWSTRRGMRCTSHTHPAHLRLVRSNEIAEEMYR